MATGNEAFTRPIQVQLSSAEIREIEAESAHYPTRQALGIEALKIVQKHRGWVADGTLRAVSRYLAIPEAELESVATFYNLIYRRPVGQHVILLCDSISCWICGASALREHLGRRLGIEPGQTTDDGLITLLPIVCLGDCDRAPTLMIDDQQYGNLTPERLDQLLDELQNAAGPSQESEHE